jgi:hypothetical protein
MADKIDIVIAAQDKATEIIKSVNSQTSILAETLGLVAVASAGLAGFAASKEFVELEKAARKLDPALRDLARSMEIGTNTDEKTILGLMKSVQRQGFATEQIDDATKAAMGLSEAMGISLTDGLTKVRQATEGNFEAFAYLIPNINELASSEEKLAAVSKLASQGLQDKADIANSATSVFDRMNVEMGNLQATIGAIIEPFRQLAYEGIATVAELLSQALKPAIDDFQKSFSGMGSSVASWSTWMTETLVAGFTLVEVTLTNIGAIAEMAGASIVLSLEQMRSQFEHIFTVAIPAYAAWFADNFINILSDIGGIVIATFSNLGTSIGEIMAGVWNYVSSGFSADAYEQLMFEVGRAANRGLLDGFEPVTKALPDIGERAVSDFEKTLQGMVDTTASSLVSEFDSKFNERIAAMNEKFEKNPLDVDVNLNAKGGALGGLKSDVNVLQSTESRLLVRGSTDDPLLKISEQQYQVLQDILNATVRREQVVLEPVS